MIARGSAEVNLFALRTRFLSLLPQRIDEMSLGLECQEPLQDLGRRFHNLAGIAGTYGLDTIGKFAAEGDKTCAVATGYDEETRAFLRFVIDSIRNASVQGIDEDAPAAGAAAGADAVQPARFTLVEAPRVLCVEDDVDQAEYFSTVLRGAGYEVACVMNPSEFAETIIAFHPDLILMDLILPGTTGVELARLVRENPAHANLPIVFLTAEQSANARIEAVVVGADDYITKPVAADLLRAVVATRLERARAMQALIEQDSLTGALTHVAFFRRVEAAVNVSRRRPEPLALVMLDLDHFKAINDRYGHGAGDRVLISLVAYLKLHLRAGDEIGRYGGEEFVLLLRNIESQNAQSLVSRLIHEFGRIPHRDAKGARFYVTFSGGVAMCDPSSDLEAWKRRADEALYAAKNHGRARVEAA